MLFLLLLLWFAAGIVILLLSINLSNKKRGLLLLVIGILFVIISIVSNVAWLREGQPWNLTMLIDFIEGPLLILIGSWFIWDKRPQAWVMTSGIIAATLLGALMALSMYLQIYLGPHRSGFICKPILKVYRNTEYKKVFERFPDKIPDNARKINYYLRPHFLQGGMIFQMQYELPNNEIKKLYDENIKAAKQVIESTGEHISLSGPNDLPCPYYYIKRNDYDWPLGYKIMILDGKADNHGFGYGIAINVEKNEVVYWAEKW